MGTDQARALHRFALLTAFCTLLLIVAGALVTGNEAGLSVPDWPLSYGSLMPPMVGGIRYEHGHRMVATFVGILTTVLAIWLWKKEPRESVRRLGLLALATVMIQGILGGLTVLFFLPVPISVMHACLAQAFFCMIVSLAWMTSPAWKTAATVGAHRSENPLLPKLCLWTTASIYLQLIFGAALRHSKSGLSLHITGALTVAGMVIWVVNKVYEQRSQIPTLSRTARLLVVLLVGQVLLGFGSYAIRVATRDDPQPALSMVAITTAHVAVGALLLGTSVVLTLQAFQGQSFSRRRLSVSAAAQKVTS